MRADGCSLCLPVYLFGTGLLLKLGCTRPVKTAHQGWVCVPKGLCSGEPDPVRTSMGHRAWLVSESVFN